jgi:hypothetical protein
MVVSESRVKKNTVDIARVKTQQVARANSLPADCGSKRTSHKQAAANGYPNQNDQPEHHHKRTPKQ